MKTLVIFGCGYVGTALALQALRRGYRVTALTRNASKAASLRKAGVHQTVEADLDAADWHKQISSHYDYGLNCVSSAGSGLAGYRKSYLNGQRSIAAWARDGRIGTFVYTSSTSVYPQVSKVIVDEETSTKGISEAGSILLAAEEALITAGACFDRWFILRLAGIYGPRRHFLLDQLRDGVSVMSGDGAVFLNMVHLDDICSAIWAALEASPHRANRIYNVVDDLPSTKGDIVNWMAQQLHRPPPNFLSKAPQGISRRRVRLDGRMPDRRVSNRRIKTELQWHLRYPDFKRGYSALLKSHTLQ